jgi:hypothetical protein
MCGCRRQKGWLLWRSAGQNGSKKLVPKHSHKHCQFPKMKLNTNKRRQRLTGALEFFTKKPIQVFVSAIVLLFVAFAILSTATYINYFVNLKVSDILSSFVTTTAILFSALWASTFVVHNMNFSRDTAKLQETLTLIRAA